jgi:hypothetical protein
MERLTVWPLTACVFAVVAGFASVPGGSVWTIGLMGLLGVVTIVVAVGLLKARAWAGLACSLVSAVAVGVIAHFLVLNFVAYPWVPIDLTATAAGLGALIGAGAALLADHD